LGACLAWRNDNAGTRDGPRRWEVGRFRRGHLAAGAESSLTSSSLTLVLLPTRSRR
jgi:hypothetical protein